MFTSEKINKKMKIIIIFILFLSIGWNIKAQDLKFHKYNQSLNYALLRNDSFYIYSKKDDIVKYDDYVVLKSIKKNSNPRITLTPQQDIRQYPFCWIVRKQRIYWISTYRFDHELNACLITENFQSIDSAKESKAIDNYIEKLKIKHSTELISKRDSLNIALHKWKISQRIPSNEQNYHLYPLVCYENEYKYGQNKSKTRKFIIDDWWYCTYDFILKDKGIDFYLRDRSQLTIWHYNFSDSHDRDLLFNEWKEESTYLKDSVPMFGKKHAAKFLSIQNMDHLKKNAIKDSTFFEGFFKVICQKDRRFIINLHTGGIFWIGDSIVAKVGQIDVKKNENRIEGKHVFVED